MHYDTTNNTTSSFVVELGWSWESYLPLQPLLRLVRPTATMAAHYRHHDDSTTKRPVRDPEEHEEVDDDDELMLTADDDGLSHADNGERSYESC